MNAIVLVGGLGTRLRPLTYDLPKPMLPILERPMVARIVEWLARYGATRVVFSLGYRPDAFVEAFPSGEWAGVELGYAVEPEPLDTAGAIAFAARASALERERLVVVNGDILTDLDVAALVDFHESTGGLATIALTPVEDPSSFGVVPTDGSGLVEAFVEKPRRETAPSRDIDAGTYVLEPGVLELVEAGRRVSIEREVFPRVVKAKALFGYVTNDYWIDTGTPEHYLEAHLDVLSGRRTTVELPESVEGPPGVHLGPGAILQGDATCAFLGNDSSVAPGSVVEEAVLGAHARVGAGATLRRSVVMSGATIETGALVEDSIVGPHAIIGKRAQLGGRIIGAAGVVEEGEQLHGSRVEL